MKNVIVSATALASSGGLSILKQFLAFASTQIDITFYIFTPGNVELKIPKNVVRIEIPSKNWLQRIYWDVFGLRQAIKALNIEYSSVVSLQNTSVNVDGKQLVYIQQSIPFSDIDTPFTKIGIKIWLYKIFYSHFIFLFSSKVDTWLVQTEWMRQAVIKKKNISPHQIQVVKPKFRLDYVERIENSADKNLTNILYPATPFYYKNHRFFIDILKKIAPEHLKEIRVHFTFKPEMDVDLIRYISSQGLIDNFVFHGVLSQQKLYELYSSVDFILFPSRLETVGLPLIEAAYLGKLILVSDLPYAHEALQDYEGAFFFSHEDENIWAEFIIKYRKGEVPEKYPPLTDISSDGWNVLENFF
ncbi:glycosyltransferase [Citrobacter amalonaticus]|uniref:glycosyltransferase n=1 Tax=Citrobacter amalonaticus TaxID=35703 RepID=UPI00300C6175